MKELSIEEKAQRYDRAIEIAKDSYNYPSYPGFIRADVVFPELKESEDERIRKVLLSHFSKYQKEEVFLNNITMGDIVAWLEAQSKHTKFAEKQDDNKLRKYIEVASNVLVKLLESDKFQKDAREHLFDKGDKELSGIYDIYAEEAVKYVKALYKQIRNEQY